MLIEQIASHSRNRISHWNCSYTSGIFHNGSYAMCDVLVRCAPEWASALHVHSASARTSRGRGWGSRFARLARATPGGKNRRPNLSLVSPTRISPLRHSGCPEKVLARKVLGRWSFQGRPSGPKRGMAATAGRKAAAFKRRMDDERREG